jgi:TRAP transporter TAXI family solute receptor
MLKTAIDIQRKDTMGSTRRSLLLATLTCSLILGYLVIFSEGLHAWVPGQKSESSSYDSGEASSYSKPSREIWSKRSGGGLFGSSSSRSGPEGYSKPRAPSDHKGEKFTSGSKFDNKLTEGSQKKQAKDSLEAYRASQNERKKQESGGTKIRQSPDGYSKPTTDHMTTSEPRSGGYTKPTPQVETKIHKFGRDTAFDKRAIEQERKQKAKASLDAYKAERAKFKQQAPKLDPDRYADNPVYQKSKAGPGFSYDEHYRQRGDHWRQKGLDLPAQMYKGRSSYGIWDAALLYGLLQFATRPDYAAFAYHHQDDPGYKEWRQNAEELAKTDSDVRRRLEEIDRQIEMMKGQGVKPDSGYLPEGVPANMAISAEAMAAKTKQKPKLRFATGPKGAIYYEVGEMLKKAAPDIEVQVIETTGSVENIELLKSGQADAALVQSDVLTKLPQEKTEQTALYLEAVQLIANRKADIISVKDIDPKKHRIYVGPKGSGTAVTWDGLCEQDNSYRKIPIEYADYKTALTHVAQDPNALMLFVGGLNSPLIRGADQYSAQTGSLCLASVDDWDFDNKKDQNGNRIYTFVEIKKGTYPSLQRGLVFNRKISTLAVKAVLTLKTDWVKANGPYALDSLTMAIEKMKPTLTKLVHGRW